MQKRVLKKHRLGDKIVYHTCNFVKVAKKYINSGFNSYESQEKR